MRAVRVFHSGVVSEWRQRDRELIAGGVELQHISAAAWDEGGQLVECRPGNDRFVTTARTIGSHPYVFLYDPRPIWRALAARPDVLDVHEEPASLAALELLVLRALRRSRAAVLFYGAQNIEKRFPPPFRWIERLALRAAAGTYCCNAEAGEIYRRKGFRGVVRVIPLGVDVTRFAPAETELPERPFRIGYVGRIERRKGVFVLLDAFTRFAATEPAGELHVYGTGPESAEFRAAVERAGLTDRVVVHGFVAHADLPECYRQLHVLAVPSQTTPEWVEQFGRVVIEAMASGTVVVGSDSGSIPEVVADAGVVVPEADAEAWARAFGELASNTEERARLRKAGLEHAEQFTWRQVGLAHRSLYDEVVAR